MFHPPVKRLGALHIEISQSQPLDHPGGGAQGFHHTDAGNITLQQLHQSIQKGIRQNFKAANLIQNHVVVFLRLLDQGNTKALKNLRVHGIGLSGVINNHLPVITSGSAQPESFGIAVLPQLPNRQKTTGFSQIFPQGRGDDGAFTAALVSGEKQVLFHITWHSLHCLPSRAYPNRGQQGQSQPGYSPRKPFCCRGG